MRHFPRWIEGAGVSVYTHEYGIQAGFCAMMDWETRLVIGIWNTDYNYGWWVFRLLTGALLQ